LGHRAQPGRDVRIGGGWQIRHHIDDSLGNPKERTEVTIIAVTQINTLLGARLDEAEQEVSRACGVRRGAAVLPDCRLCFGEPHWAPATGAREYCFDDASPIYLNHSRAATNARVEEFAIGF
jgi:hypothetical protein